MSAPKGVFMAEFLTEAERMRIISGMKLTDNLFFTKVPYRSGEDEDHQWHEAD